SRWANGGERILPAARRGCAPRQAARGTGPSPAGDARSALPLPEPAVLDPVAAGGHVAPGAGPAVGAVVEGPPAVRVAAGLQPLQPGAAGGHVAPGAGPAVGAVVDGPPAARVAPGLQPRPAGTTLRAADRQQQGEHPRAEPAGRPGAGLLALLLAIRDAQR